MNSILSELFCGKYVGAAPSGIEGSELEEAFLRAEKIESELKKQLPEELQDKFQEYTQACADREFLVGQQDFISGFRLAVRLFAEGLED